MFEIGKLGRLTIGFVNENEARVIDIDMTGWLEDFPDGNIGLLVKRPWEDTFYPADLKREGNVVIWKPTRADMMIDGEGEAQFVLTNAEGVELRSRVVGTKINASLGGTAGAKPAPEDSFVQTVINAAAQAEAAVEKMPSIGENGNWHAWDANAGEYVDTGKPSRGERGERGEQGVQGIQGIPGQQGIPGERGLPGERGERGEQGLPGVQGVPGPAGPAGERGLPGERGPAGERGLTGERGPAGKDGRDGYTPVKGKDYFDGKDGQDGYTPVKGKDYFDGAQGPAGRDGKDGYTPVKGKDYFDGQDGYTPQKGIDYFDGTSVTVASVSESNADGGTNVVTFSDGKTVAIKNGSKGSQGNAGTSVQVANVSESTADGGSNVVTFSDGKTVTIKNGKTGKDGTGVTILGSYASLDALTAAHPTGNPGDAYLIDGYLYVWSASDKAWKNVGKIQGPAGETGPQGIQGPAGNPGKDGTSVTVANVSTSNEDGGTNTVTFSDGKTLSVKNGSKGSQGIQGIQGPTGSPGKDGTSVTVANVSTSSEDGGTNTVTFSDGKTLSVKNGSKGSTGATGATGPTGPAGSTGKDGTSVTVASVATSSADGGANVVTFSDGKTVTILNGSKGSQGIQGVQGPAGSPGKDGRDGVDGDTRVYIGSDNPPEDAELWVDPEGTVNSDDLPQATEETAGVVTLDATLTKQGAAADAKAVGAKVAKLSEEIAKISQSSGGAAIIDTPVLPESNIQTDVFYRSYKCTFYNGGVPFPAYVCEVVETLPSTGEPATDPTFTQIYVYYATDTMAVSGYAPEWLAGAFGIPEGWYPVEMLFSAAGLSFAGVVTSTEEMADVSAIYVLLETNVVYRDNNKWNDVLSVGNRGTGSWSEIFNYENNVASEDYTHAEGYSTKATGPQSHAEGNITEAAGANSHAEGYASNAKGLNSHAEGYASNANGEASHAEGASTNANGYASHAEGASANANGEASHAEGASTNANGEASHAEGSQTIAASINQHVQGKYNIEDASGRYAHIVGNGSELTGRSNAHTLDWDGNAWFAGGIELTSPNGTRYRFTVSDDGTLTATVVTE